MKTRSGSELPRLFGCLISCLLFGLVAIQDCTAQDVITAPMNMTPYKIILNAQGQADSFQSILSMTLPSGHRLVDYEVELSLNDLLVLTAYDFRYCYLDYNFLAQFDREELLAHPIVQELAGSIAVATVAGWYYAEDSAGNGITRFFTGSDLVEILAPGRK